MIGFDKLAKHKLCYLATPYTKHNIHRAWVNACIFAGGLVGEGVSVYSPIAHTHPIALFGNFNPLDHEMWMSIDGVMMDLADALIVAEMPGWTESKGVQHEIAAFEKAQKPIYYLPGDCFA